MNEDIELEKSYSSSEIAAKLRRLADALESQKTFNIQIDNQQVKVPPSAVVEIEYEKTEDGEELEFEIKWQ